MGSGRKSGGPGSDASAAWSRPVTAPSSWPSASDSTPSSATRSSTSAGLSCGREPLAEVAEPRQHVRPPVAGIGHEVLEQGHGGRLALAGIFRPAGQPGYVNEAWAVREEAQHLEVQVDAGLRPSDGLEDQAPVEEDRGIALLARVWRGRHAVKPVPRGVIPGPHRRAAKAPAGRCEGALRLDRVEQTRPEARVPVRVEESEAAERVRSSAPDRPAPGRARPGRNSESRRRGPAAGRAADPRGARTSLPCAPCGDRGPCPRTSAAAR